MHFCRGLAFIALLAPFCPAQTNLSDAELEKNESLIMELMLRQSAPEIKLVVLDQFWKEYERAERLHWAYDEICKAFDAANQPARALSAGEKLLGRDPRDIETAEKSLKIAEATKDAALIEKWTGL